jgi:hypothetical protein
MGEWLLSRKDRLIVAWHEVPFVPEGQVDSSLARSAWVGMQRLSITSNATGVALNPDPDVIEACCIYERAHSVSVPTARHSARKEAHLLVVSPASNLANRVS